jgi:hypothetical protein
MFHHHNVVVESSDDLDKLSEGELEGEAGADSEGKIGKPCSNLLVRQNVVSVVTNNPEIGLLKPGKRICNMFT